MPNKPDELDELHELLIKKLNTKKRMIEPHDERFVIGFQTEAPGDDVDWQYLDEVIMRYVGDSIRTEKLNQAHDDNLQEAKQAIQAHIDKKVVEARIDEWKLISEVTHSANLVACSYLGKARDERIKQLRSES